MTFENIDSRKDEVKKDPIEEKMNQFFLSIFEGNETAEEKFTAFENRLQKFLVVRDDSILSQEEIDNLKNSLREACKIDDPEEFSKQCLFCLQPLIEWRKNHPKEFESIQRENFVAASEFIPINETLSYGEGKNSLHIHIAPSETMSLSEKLSMLKDGFVKLAEIVRDKKNIQEVWAKSWIVAAKPGILEKLGFTVLGEISAEEKEQWFRDEKRAVFKAKISRDDLINKYLHQK